MRFSISVLNRDKEFVDPSKIYRTSLFPFVRRETTYKPNAAYALLCYVASSEFQKDRHIGKFNDNDLSFGKLVSNTLLPPDITLDI